MNSRQGRGLKSGWNELMRVYPFVFLAGLASTSAFAADAVIEEPPAPVAVIEEVPIFSWTGGYLGIQGGGLWSNSSVNGPDTGIFDDTFNGGLLGAYAGYNWQFGAWVLGVEGDINGVWNDETVTINTARFGNRDVDIGSSYLASIRARAGYAFDRTLIFATGGVAFTQFSAEAGAWDEDALDTDKSLTGWTIGLGAEYAFTNNWIGRLEYRFYDFSESVFDDFGDVGLDTNTLTVGVAYKF